ncbi:hypothetical protein, partial [Ralstonia solanacearum]|uniref:hypothetical protein n=1 Tax=Ralstonia solanacearum TaxID=305 RepID=UPI0019D36D32
FLLVCRAYVWVGLVCVLGVGWCVAVWRVVVCIFVVVWCLVGVFEDVLVALLGFWLCWCLVFVVGWFFFVVVGLFCGCAVLVTCCAFVLFCIW